MILAGAIVALTMGWSDTCTVPTILPAYSHNDYLNTRPLMDALATGYRGVEVDLYRDGQRLMVGHDRRSALGFQTLEALYLRPLQERISRCGFILLPRTPFFLFIELKEQDQKAFQLLVTELMRREASLFRGGQVRQILVGWWPATDGLGPPWPSYLTAQLPFEGWSGDRAPPGPTIGLVSVDYSKTLRWNGRGLVPEHAREALARARTLGNALSVPVRVHQVPNRAGVFDWLLESGVDLIGVKELDAGTPLLMPRNQPPNPTI